MERRRTILLACAAIAGAAMLCGCSKSEGGLGFSGEIQFGMVSRGGQATKTVYGDDVTSGGKKYQRLDWEKGDVVTIASPQAIVQNDPNKAHASNYVISQVLDPVAGDPQRRAKVVNEAANGLMWLDEFKKYNFYAIYPKAFSEENASISLTKDGVVSAKIPGEQTNTASEKTKKSDDESVTYTVYEPKMKYAFMTGALYEFEPESNTQTVPIVFTPAFTAFEFNVSSQEEDIEITEIQLEAQGSDVLTGSFSMNLAKDADKTVQVSGDKTATLKTTTEEETEVDGKTVKTTKGVTVTATQGASFTLFTLPKDNTEALKLRVTSKDGDATKTSYVMLTYAKEGTDLDDETTTHAAKAPVVFKAGHKYRINMLRLPSSQWKITISVELEKWGAGEGTVIYI